MNGSFSRRSPARTKLVANAMQTNAADSSNTSPSLTPPTRQKGWRVRGAIGNLQGGQVRKYLLCFVNLQRKSHNNWKQNWVQLATNLRHATYFQISAREAVNRAVKERFSPSLLRHVASGQRNVVSGGMQRGEWEEGGRGRIRSGAMGIFPNEDKKRRRRGVRVSVLACTGIPWHLYDFLRYYHDAFWCHDT